MPPSVRTPPTPRCWLGLLLMALPALAATPTPSELWQRARHAPGLTLRPSGDGALSGRNRGQGLVISLGASGLTVTRGLGGPSISLRLSAVGRGGHWAALPPRAFNGQEAHRAAAEHAGLREVWENRPEGLEHLFELPRRWPGTGPLELELAVTGAAPARRGPDVVLTSPEGWTLIYGGLRVFGADGRVLPSRLVVTPVGVRLSLDDAHARYPVTIDPLLTAQEVTSNRTWSELGDAVALADVNGDGFKDAVGAAPYDQPTYMGPDRGKVLLFKGSAAGLSPTPAWSKGGDQDYMRFGLTLSNAGDVNHDGFEDVIIGSPFRDGPAGADVGRAELYLGSAQGLGSTAAWSVLGDQAGEMRGAVAGVGDVNHDGFADVVVGAPNRTPGGGTAFLYLGRAGGLAPTPAWSASGGQAGAAFGFSVGPAGDVNADGYADVLIGDYGWSVGGQASAGKVSLFLGGPSGLAASPAWTHEGTQAGQLLGEWVGTARDVDHDGFDDLAFSSPLSSNGTVKVGRVEVYPGSSSGPGTRSPWVMEGSQDQAWFGVWAGGGDVNGDGFSDLVVGAYRQTGSLATEGAAHLYYGSSTGLLSGPVWSAFGEEAGAGQGYSVGVGDVTGDHLADLVAGAPFYEREEMLDGEGALRLYAGCPDWDRDGACDGALDGGPGPAWDAGARADGGASSDAGPVPDAGSSADGGAASDAGAGGRDGGGSTPDAGSVGFADAGQVPGRADAGASDIVPLKPSGPGCACSARPGGSAAWLLGALLMAVGLRRQRGLAVRAKAGNMRTRRDVR